jgi:phosphohistidine phosphatase
MRQLLLLRHAKSSWDDPKLPDHARPLNARGRRAAEAVRGVLSGLGLRPDLVLVSSARRTLQTLEALEPWDGVPAVEPLDALYLAGAADLLAALQAGGREAGCVMLLGHNPGLHELALLLCGPGSEPAERARLEDAFPTASLAVLSVAGAWPELGAGGGALRHFVRPADLPGAAAP